ncbi:MAG: hypothetical protein FJ146_13160 [Deltaproteobacteria bacterium]|nr:hypothetical protein [Deltaproteobacteria bacterium]
MDPRREKFEKQSRDLHAFFKLVGKVWIYEELKFLDLEPQMMTGEFRSCHAQSLLDFCRSNPEYHIVSGFQLKVFNKFVPNARIYYLADGDSDPDLYFELGTRLGVQETLQVGHAMFATKFSKIKRSNDA